MCNPPAWGIFPPPQEKIADHLDKEAGLCYLPIAPFSVVYKKTNIPPREFESLLPP